MRFEAAMRESAELRAMVREMREGAADLVHSVPSSQPPAELKGRLLREIALEKQSGQSPRPASTSLNWLPWAIAALILVCCGGLVFDRARLQRELANLREADPLAHATLVSLASPTGELPETKVVVAWQPDRQSGVITIQSPPASRERSRLPTLGDRCKSQRPDQRRSHSRRSERHRADPLQAGAKRGPGQSVCDQSRTRRWWDEARGLPILLSR